MSHTYTTWKTLKTELHQAHGMTFTIEIQEIELGFAGNHDSEIKGVVKRTGQDAYSCDITDLAVADLRAKGQDPVDFLLKLIKEDIELKKDPALLQP